MYNPGAVIIISLLLYNRVIHCDGSFLMDRIIENNIEDVLQRFFAEYRMHLRKYDTWDVTVIGGSDDQLQRVKPLLEDFPHFIGMNLTDICASKQWSSKHTVVVIFLDSLKEEYLTKRMEDLKGCVTKRFYLIFESGSAISYADMNLALRLSLSEIKQLPLLMHHDDKENSLKAYGYVQAKDCSRRTELIVDWMPGDDMKKFDTWFTYLVSAPGCSINIATMHNPPSVDLDEHATGGVNIKGGFEGKIITEFAKNINHAPVIQNFEVSARDRSSAVDVIVSSCAAGNSSIGIGPIRPTESMISKVAVSQSYTEECVVWCVPRIIRLKKDPFSGFSWIIWMLVGIMFLAYFGVDWIVRNTAHLNRGIVRKPDCVRQILDIVGTILGNPIVYRPLSVGSKALLIMYIGYSMVMTTAFKTSLSSAFTVGNMESMIVDVEGIIRANLTIGGNPLRLAVLEGQRNESEWIPELIKRFVIETNVSKALRRISNEKDFAYLTSRTTLAYHKALFEKSGEQISFDVLDGCVLSYTIVAVTPYGARVYDNLNKFLLRLIESGILMHWKKDTFMLGSPKIETAGSLGMMNSREELHIFTRKTIFSILNAYCVAMVLCILVFWIELIVHKYKSTRRNNRLNNLNLFKVSPPVPLQSASRQSD